MGDEIVIKTEELISLSTQLGKHEVRIENLEANIDKHTCKNEMRLSELELNQKLITNTLIDIKSEILQSKEDAKEFRNEVNNINKNARTAIITLIIGFIGIIAALIFTSFGFYTTNLNKMDKQFQVINAEINNIKEYMYKNLNPPEKLK